MPRIMKPRCSSSANRVEDRDSDTFGLSRGLYIGLLAWYGLIAVASFLPGKRLWGVNHLAFYPLRIRIGLLVIAGSAFVPSIARALYEIFLDAAAAVSSRRTLAQALSIIIPIAAVLVFFQFRSATLLLGDGQLIADNLEHAFQRDTAVIARSAETIVEHEHIARGTTLLYHAAGRISTRLLTRSPVAAVSLLACLLGGLVIFVVLRGLMSEAMNGDQRIWITLLILSCGTIQIFFGYVENYAPLLTLATLYLMSGLKLMHRPSRRWLALTATFLILAGFVHIQGVLLIPSFGLLVAWFVAGRRRRVVLRYAMPVLVVAFLITAGIAGTVTELRSYYLPLTTTAETSGVLTPSHWLDIANELVLLLPILPVIVLMAIMCARSRNRYLHSDDRDGAEPGAPCSADRAARRELLADSAESRFVSLILIPSVVFLVFFKPKLGMARDWDLFALTSIGLIPLAALVLTRYLGRIPRPQVSLISAPAAVLACVVTFAWVGINSSGKLAVGRFERILEYDTSHAPYAYEVLAKHHYDHDRLGQAIAAMEKAVSFSYNSRLYALLGVYYRDHGRLPDAIEMFRQILVYDPASEPVRHELVLMLYRAGQYDELLEVARAGTQYHPHNPIFHDFYGRMLIRQGNLESGITELRLSKDLNPPPEALKQIEQILERIEAIKQP
jgi:hypothetical protein